MDAPRLEMDRRALLAGAAAAALLPSPGSARGTVPPAHGWNPEARAPEAADVVVSPDGDDSGPGTAAAPLRTIGAGVAALAGRGAGSLAIRGGTYREAVSLDALRGRPDAPFRLHRFGAERVTITACEPLEGWRPLDPGAAAALGLPGGRVWRATLPRDAVPAAEGPGLNLFEAGAWCPQATWREDPSDPSRLGDAATFWAAGETATDGEDRILEIRDRRLAGIAPGGLEHARLLVWHRPNLVSRVRIEAVRGGGTGLALGGAELRAQLRDGRPATRYALQNVPEGMAEGHWMLGPGTTRRALEVLYWPRDPENLARMEYGARDHCIDLGRAAHLELFGLEAVGASGARRYEGSAIRRRLGATGGAGIALRHCRAGDVQAFDARGHGSIALADCTGLVLENVTVEGGRNTFGLFLYRCRDVAVSGLHVRAITNSAARFFGLRDAVLSFSLFEDGGADSHANQFNFYEGCDRVLVYGVRTRRLGGYVTYQEASRIHFAFCDIEIDPAGRGRALVSQNRRPGAGQGGPDGSGEPVTGGTFLYWNNTLQPPPRPKVPANSLSLGPSGSSQRHAFYNNFLHGGGVPHVYTEGADPAMERRAHNRYSGTAYWQQARRGWRLAPGETLGGAAGLGRLRGRDMRDVIARLAPAFPRFRDWDRDVDGRPVDWDAPPVGCRVF